MGDDWDFDAALEDECNFVHGEAVRDLEEFAEVTEPTTSQAPAEDEPHEEDGGTAPSQAREPAPSEAVAEPAAEPAAATPGTNEHCDRHHLFHASACRDPSAGRCSPSHAACACFK